MSLQRMVERAARQALNDINEAFDDRLITIVRSGHRGPVWIESWTEGEAPLLVLRADFYLDRPTAKEFANGRRWRMFTITEELAGRVLRHVH